MDKKELIKEVERLLFKESTIKQDGASINIMSHFEQQAKAIVEFFSLQQGEDTKSEWVSKFNSICEESLSPDVFEMWKKVEEQLKINRSDLK